MKHDIFSTFRGRIFIRKDEIRVSKTYWPWKESKRHAIRQRFSRMTFNLFGESARLCHYTQEKTDLWLFRCDIDKKHSGKIILSWGNCCSHPQYFSVSVTQLLAQMTLSRESAWHTKSQHELVTMIMNHRFGAFGLLSPHIIRRHRQAQSDTWVKRKNRSDSFDTWEAKFSRTSGSETVSGPSLELIDTLDLSSRKASEQEDEIKKSPRFSGSNSNTGLKYFPRLR